MNIKPKATFTIKGEIEDFTRIDNLFSTMKTQGAKLLKNYEITIEASYFETQEK